METLVRAMPVDVVEVSLTAPTHAGYFHTSVSLRAHLGSALASVSEELLQNKRLVLGKRCMRV